jgi:hypothetical protein
VLYRRHKDEQVLREEDNSLDIVASFGIKFHYCLFEILRFHYEPLFSHFMN